MWVILHDCLLISFIFSLFYLDPNRRYFELLCPGGVLGSDVLYLDNDRNDAERPEKEETRESAPDHSRLYHHRMLWYVTFIYINRTININQFNIQQELKVVTW